MQKKSNSPTIDFLGLAAVVFFVVAAGSVTTAVGTVAELMESDSKVEVLEANGWGSSVTSDAMYSSSGILSGLKGHSPDDSNPVTALSIVMVLT